MRRSIIFHLKTPSKMGIFDDLTFYWGWVTVFFFFFFFFFYRKLFCLSEVSRSLSFDFSFVGKDGRTLTYFHVACYVDNSSWQRTKVFVICVMSTKIPGFGVVR